MLTTHAPIEQSGQGSAIERGVWPAPAQRRACPSAAQRLAEAEFGLSLRQAYRYLEEAAELNAPVEVVEATVPVTLKLPPTTVRALRAHARSSGLTIGVIVTRALGAFLAALRRHGSTGLHGAARLKSISIMRFDAVEFVTRP